MLELSSRYWMREKRKRPPEECRVYTAQIIYFIYFQSPTVPHAFSFFSCHLPLSRGEILSNDQFSLNQIRSTTTNRNTEAE